MVARFVVDDARVDLAGRSILGEVDAVGFSADAHAGTVFEDALDRREGAKQIRFKIGGAERSDGKLFFH